LFLQPPSIMVKIPLSLIQGPAGIFIQINTQEGFLDIAYH
jgi:hypothetical protein